MIVDLQQVATQRTEMPDSLSLYHLVNSLPCNTICIATLNIYENVQGKILREHLEKDEAVAKVPGVDN